MLHYCFILTPITWNFIQRLPLSWRCALFILEPKGQGHNALINEKWFMLHDCFPFTLILKFHTKTPHKLRIYPMDFGVKRSKLKVNALITENGVCCIISIPFIPIMKLHSKTPHEWRMCPFEFGVKKIKGQGHSALITENGLCRIIAFPLHT